MKSYKEPTYQERVGRAAKAKEAALEQLRSRPAVNEQDQAERLAARLARDAAANERRVAKKAAELAAKAARASHREEEAAPDPVAQPTEADLKAARDARYAARKQRR